MAGWKCVVKRFNGVDAVGAGLALAAALVLASGTARAQGDPSTPPGVATQTPKATPSSGDKIMTRAEAKELLDSVDTIMQFASRDSGLPPVLKVKRRLVTRDEVNKYLVKSFEDDESAKRLQRSEIVLKKFGLLSDDFDLKPFLLSLLTEQIAGFYDDKTKIVNLLNWIPPDEQKPVLAHELTHAVQDQKVGLTNWSSTGFKGVSKTASEDAARIQVDELETARQAVTEGQAMVVFVDYGLKDTGKTLADVPGLVDSMKASAADPSGSPIMARAPLLLQRSLAFPYTDGLGFEAALLARGGKQLAFAGALDRPPSSSFEVMTPAAYLAHTPVPVLRLPDVHTMLDAEYEPYDVGVMGELDVEMMASLFGGPAIAQALAPAWDGGVYYAAQRRSATPAEKATPGSLGLLYFSRWKTADAAVAFERIYTAELGRKYDKLVERKTDEREGEQVYTTGQGDVLLSLDDKGVWISEGFPLTLGRKLRDAVTQVQGTGPMQSAACTARACTTPRGELSMSTSQALGGFGMMRFAEQYTGAAK